MRQLHYCLRGKRKFRGHGAGPYIRQVGRVLDSLLLFFTFLSWGKSSIDDGIMSPRSPRSHPNLIARDSGGFSSAVINSVPRTGQGFRYEYEPEGPIGCCRSCRRQLHTVRLQASRVDRTCTQFQSLHPRVNTIAKASRPLAILRVCM